MVLTKYQNQEREAWIDAISYRIPYAVTELRYYRNDGSYPICPRCKRTLERTYQLYCDRCGQRLDWDGLDRAVVRIG